jgi:Flp pilus assembly protein TadD
LLIGCTGLARRFQPDDVVSARQIAQRGMDAADAGNWQRAEEYFGEAVQVCPTDERVRWRFANALWHRGSRDEAIQHMGEAIRLSGGDPELQVRFGEMLLQVGDLQQAGEMADEVIRSGRQLASAYRLKGDVLVRQGSSSEALAAYHHAMGLQDHYPEVQIAAARVYYASGRPQRALSTLQSLCHAYTPGEEPAEALYWQGLACAKLGRHQQAVTNLTLAQRQGVQTADLLYQLAASHHALGNRSAAQSTLQQALAFDPSHPQSERLCQQIRGGRHVASLPK